RRGTPRSPGRPPGGPAARGPPRRRRGPAPGGRGRRAPDRASGRTRGPSLAQEDRRMPTTTRRPTVTLAGLEVPVIELTGAAGGPRLTVLAGVHGCEYASMAAVREWARGLEHRGLRGRVVAVPVLNLPAFRARSPFVVPDDGKNLNRCFPGDP